MKPPWLDDHLASNGKAVLENFTHWFGQSQITSSRGEPLTMYHGSPDKPGQAAFGTQGNQVANIKSGRPFFVTDDYDYALDFARGGHVQALYVRIERPVNLADETTLQTLLEIFNNDTVVLSSRGKWDEALDGDIAESAYFLLESAEVMKHLANEGFDGAMIPEDVELKVTSYAVFSPDQIKSTNNSGLYLRDSSDITDGDHAMDLGNQLKSESAEVWNAKKPRKVVP